MTSHRLRHLGRRQILGRRHQVGIEIGYAGRSLPRDAADTLVLSVRAVLDNQASDLSFLVSPDVYNRIIVGATLTATMPAAAMARVGPLMTR